MIAVLVAVLLLAGSLGLIAVGLRHLFAAANDKDVLRYLADVARPQHADIRADSHVEAFVVAARRAAAGTLTGDTDALDIAEETGAPIEVVFAAIDLALSTPPEERRRP